MNWGRICWEEGRWRFKRKRDWWNEYKRGKVDRKGRLEKDRWRKWKERGRGLSKFNFREVGGRWGK